jgi:hypothetical protein
MSPVDPPSSNGSDYITARLRYPLERAHYCVKPTVAFAYAFLLKRAVTLFFENSFYYQGHQISIARDENVSVTFL